MENVFWVAKLPVSYSRKVIHRDSDFDFEGGMCTIASEVFDDGWLQRLTTSLIADRDTVTSLTVSELDAKGYGGPYETSVWAVYSDGQSKLVYEGPDHTKVNTYDIRMS